MPEDLPAQLQAALAAKGPGYGPRTHHLLPATSGAPAPKYTNRLILQTSPYLLQHAHNPVSWFPWGDEAFAEARRRNVPVFLSIGYSTCHWCHVMEGESFEDEEIAAVMNTQFVCIKVDREERPDVDAVYMSAVQALTGGGGWPMSVWLTPDREPFFGGTYFPPRDGTRGAQTGFLTLMKQLSTTYSADPARVKKATAALTSAIKESMEGRGRPDVGAPQSNLPTARAITTTIEYFKRAFDPTHGGVRRAPKFPSNLPIRLLLRFHRRTGDEMVLRMATLTLEKMAAGGMYDQIGGGFHRYSTDERWLVPHFEKMLYDNALLAVAYAEAFQVTRNPNFARVVREILDYLLREMQSPEGGFYSATDADSEGHEGKFFVWSASEVQHILGAEAARFMRTYGITPAGNFESHNIPTLAALDHAEHAALADARRRLYDVRAKRPAPLRDEKILAAWNGLALSAFATGGRILNEPRYVAAARRAAGFLDAKMRGKDGRMQRSHTGGQVGAPGFIEDQAFVAAGLLDLYEASFDERFLAMASALCEATETHFADREHGGWFMTAGDAEKLIAREKPHHDGAEPSGTSVAILNALRLGAFTSDDRWRVVAEKALAALSMQLTDRGVAMTEALLAVDFLTDTPREIALVWPAASPTADHEALVNVLRNTFLPNRVIAAAPEGAQLASTAKIARFLEGKVAAHGKPTAYVCERGRCELPTTDERTFTDQIRKAKNYDL